MPAAPIELGAPMGGPVRVGKGRRHGMTPLDGRNSAP